jgi:hypothetical protein
MLKEERAARQIVAQAIQAKGSYELDQVVEYIVEHYYNMVSAWPSVRKSSVVAEVYNAIERIGFATTSDVQRVIDELMQRGRLAG